jgi:para-nitrobenzyl esterase
VVSDTRYACAARQSSRALGAGGSIPYRFWFSHRPERPPYDRFGATHGLELMYLFGTYQAHGYEPTDAEQGMAREWQRAYAGFVHEGSPEKFGGRSWSPDGEPPGFILGIGAPRSGAAAGRDEYCDFWDELVQD